MAARQQYTDEDIYIMVSLVLHYPKGGHGGEAFWASMLSIYSGKLLEGRIANGLRNKWRKIAKEHPTDLEEYRKELAEKLDKETVESIEQKIKDGISGLDGIPLSQRNRSSLAPKLFIKNEEEEKKKKEKIREEKPAAEEKKAVEPSPPCEATNIDLNKIVPKKPGSIGLVAEGAVTIDLNFAEHLIISKDLKENTVVVKDMKESCPPEELLLYEKIDAKLNELSKKYNQPVEQLVANLSQVSGNFEDLEKYLEGKPVKLWNELEDMALRNPENMDMQNWLLKTKGTEAINKRKKFLGIK
eukprot:TRINITY_DN924_c0_g1_i1.p5 TRINITY_DN924_c0_g1~~TRINITY_DN924_c0_g1_i1.p5  ORF type:complete len:300 (+),score=68.74 TRINITY_DN924_c0_g1_i1:2618-3517(+)